MSLHGRYPIMHVVDPDWRGLAGDRHLKITRRGYLSRGQAERGLIHSHTARYGLRRFLHMLTLYLIVFVHFVLGHAGRGVSRQKGN